MATFEQRGAKWRCKVRIGGVEDSGTFDSKALAKTWARLRETELSAITGGKVGTHTLRETLAKYSDEVSPTKRGARWEKLRLAKFARDIKFVDTRIDRIGAELWSAWRDQRLKQVGPASVLREIGLLSAVMTAAVRDWRWITSNTIMGISKPPKPRARTRLMSDVERDQILSSVGYVPGTVPVTISEQVGWALMYALETSMRAGEICGLKRSDVALADRVATLPMTKNGDRREVPQSAAAIDLLKLGLASEGNENGTIVAVKVGSLDALFRKATDRCKIVDLHFHDSRATALTRMSRLPKMDVMTLSKISGHRDINLLVRVYFRETATSIAARL